MKRRDKGARRTFAFRRKRGSGPCGNGMENKQKRTWAEISLKNIEHNICALKAAVAPGTRFLGVVKADAYGHGAVRVSRMMEEKKLADGLAVACLDEAEVLRESGITLPILIMGFTPPEFTHLLQRLGITQAVGDIQAARAMSERLSAPLKVHVKLETGMGRTGFDPRSPAFEKDMRTLFSLSNIVVEGAFTHFAVSDEPQYDFTHIQYRRFLRALARIQEITGERVEIKHCANSGAVVNYKAYAMDMIRPGIATYGMYPGAERGGIGLKPAMQLKSRITHVYDHFPGDTLSYGRTHVLTEQRRIAVVPIGYADGLHRVASGKYEFLLQGKRVKQLGRVCMDMCMIDVTEIPDCKSGGVVTVFGLDGENFISVEEQAEKAGTISYEQVCSVSRRVPRIYLD